MSLPFSPADDFESVTDGLESVTLFRRESPAGPGVVISQALHRTIDMAELVGSDRKTVESDGRYLAADAAWSLPVAALSTPPRLGDILLDAAGRRWTILEFRQVALGTRWRCRTRELSIAYGLEDQVAILQAEYRKSISGAIEITWITVQQAIRARIQPMETRIASEPTSPQSVARCRVILETPFFFDHRHRIRGPGNISYRILSAGGFPRLGELQTVEVEKILSFS